MRSPMETGSHAEWLEEALLADMGPDEKWELAVAKAPKCPKRASVPSQPPPEKSTPEIASTSGLAVGVPTPDLPPPVRGVKRSSAGEEGAMVEAILDFEGSTGEMEERETQSERAVEELHQWLLQGDQPANPPPPYNRENRRQSFPSSAPSGVETILGSSRGAPRHIRENIECEQNFKRLPFAAIKPFPAEEQEWDADEPGPCPLQNGLEWPRGRGRRTRFNPRSVEQGRDRPPAPVPVGELPATESTPIAEEGGEVIRTPAVVPETTTTPHDGAARDDAVEIPPPKERPPSSNAWAGDGPPLGREDRPTGSRTCAGAPPWKLYSGVSAPCREMDAIRPAALALTAGRVGTRVLIVVSLPACFAITLAAGEPR